MSSNHFARWLLTAGLVFVFGTFGIWKFTQPIIWIGWVPLWFDDLLGLSKNVWLTVFGAIELLLAAALLIPIQKVRKFAVVLMILHLIAVITQAGWTDTGVRDIGLLFAAGALYFLLNDDRSDHVLMSGPAGD